MKFFALMIALIATSSASALMPKPQNSNLAILKDTPLASEDGVKELDPFAASTVQVLNSLRNSPDFQAPKYADSPYNDLLQDVSGGCQRKECRLYVFIQISERPQRAHVYYEGQYMAGWKISTGKAGHPTQTYNGHPGGYIATDYYDSKKYPEGDYMGLGNMPYAMFYSGGFALHGTTVGAFKRLGEPASHGCVRMHPENAAYLNMILHEVGRDQTWFEIVP